MRCAVTLAEHHPGEAARFLERLPADEVGAFFERVPPGVGAALLARMSVAAAATTLGAMSESGARAAVLALSGDVQASVLRRQPPETRAALLEGVPSSARRVLERRLDHAEGTAGALADSDVPAFAEQLTATEARRRLRQTWSAGHRYAYVTDDSHRLVGVISARDLARARARDTLGSIKTSEVISLAAHADLTAILEHPAWRDFDPLPVIDRAGVFVGAIRHQRLRELGAPGTGGSLTDTLLHLGELYWIGLSAVFPAVSGTATPPGSAAEKGPGHGA